MVSFIKARIIFSLMSILLYASNAIGQHCSFEHTRICIISIDDSLKNSIGKIELCLIDSLGNELLSTRKRKKQYCVDNTSPNVTLSRFFFFGKTGSLRLGDHYYPLSRMNTVSPNDFFLAMLDKQLETLFENKGNFYLQLRRKKGDDSHILAQVKISHSDFQLGCTSAQHWHHKDEMTVIKLSI